MYQERPRNTEYLGEDCMPLPPPKAAMEQYTVFKHTLIKCVNGV